MGAIRMLKENNELIITITSAKAEIKPVALIINYSGEVIEKHELVSGENKIDVSRYKDRNCAVRILNDKNVVLRKI